jgi:hypothetical protein
MILGMKVLVIAVAHLILLAAIKQAEAAALRSGEDEPQQQQQQQQQQRSLIIGGTPAADLEFPFFVQARGVRFASQKSRRCCSSFVFVASQMCPRFATTILVGRASAEARSWRRMWWPPPLTAPVRVVVCAWVDSVTARFLG